MLLVRVFVEVTKRLDTHSGSKVLLPFVRRLDRILYELLRSNSLLTSKVTEPRRRCVALGARPVSTLAVHFPSPRLPQVQLLARATTDVQIRDKESVERGI